MLKKFIFWICIIILAIVIGFFIGQMLYNTEEKDNINIAEENVINKNVLKKEKNNIVDVELQTSVQEEKIGINTQIIEQIYYNECDHIISETIKDTEKFVNLNKGELEKRYPEWEVKEFSQDKVVLYKEDTDYCNEHFLVKDVDGYVTTYTLNSKDEVLEILDKTDIATEYLTQTDKNNLTRGIKVYTKQNLNKLIEDFE